MVVVTGGAGFVGSHLVEALVASGHQVTVVDNFSTGRRENLPVSSQVQVVEATLGDTYPIDALIASAELVYHLASPVGVRRAHSSSHSTIDAILRGGMDVARACRRHRCPLLFTSSSEVYGSGGTMHEGVPARIGVEPRWSYAAGKLALEHLLMGLSHEHDLPCWIVRLFNVVGARQRPDSGMVLPAFVAAARAGRPLTVHGDGSQRRVFLHAADAAEGLIAIAGSAPLRGRPVNLGGREDRSIRGLAESVCATVGSSSPLQFVSHETIFGTEFAPVHERKPDLTRLQEATGWQPRRTLDDAIHDQIRWQESL